MRAPIDRGRRGRTRRAFPFHAIALALAAGASLGGCTRLADVGAATVVTCGSAAECPAGRVCNGGRCVRPGDLGIPPDLVGGAVSVMPARGAAGTTFTLALEATRPLDAVPRVILGLAPLVDLPCTATTDVRYTCSYTATGQENGGLGGRVSIDVRMTDRAGNETTRNGVGALDLDFAPPSLAARSAEPAEVALGGVLQVFFSVNEELDPRRPLALMASRPLDEGGPRTVLTPVLQPGTRNYQYTHLVTPSDAPGPVTFTVTLVDVVGNSTVAATVGTVVVDLEPTEITSVLVAPPRVGAGGTLSVSFDTSEAAAGDALSVSVGGRPMSCGAFAASASPSYACTRPVPRDELPPGTEQVQSVVVTLADRAGNRSSASGNVVLDFRAPGLAGRSVEPGTVPQGSTFVVSFTPDEELGAAPVLVASRPLEGPGGPQDHFVPERVAGTRNYQLAHAVTAGDPAGTVEFSVELGDVVGNTTVAAVGAVFLDAVPPEIGAVVVEPARVDPSGVVTVSLEVTEVGALAVTVGGRALACGPWVPAAIGWANTCVRPMQGDELPAGEEAPQSVVAVVTDGAGNRAVAGGSVVFDFRGPGVAGADVVHAPPPGSPLPAVRRAAAGARVTMTVLANEALSLAAPPTLQADLAGSALAFSYVTAASTPTAAIFEAVVQPGTADGSYVATVTWTDLAGNTARTDTGIPQVEVKTSTPVLAIAQDALVFVRSPLGNASDEQLGSYTIPAGPYFAVEPAEPLTPTPTLPVGALLLADGEVPAQVIVQSTGDAQAIHVGTLQPGPGGTFPRQRLVSPDLPGVWLVGVDDAGNRSAPVPLQTTEWVASSNAPMYGASPHVLRTIGQVSVTRAQDRAATRVEDPGASGADAGAVMARPAGLWRQLGDPGAIPANDGARLAYDAARGRVVLFGGEGNTWVTSYPQATWEWDGVAWTQAAYFGPRGRIDHAMAWDGARGRVVLFGGIRPDGPTEFVLNDTWEWDGASWTSVVTPGPSARGGHAMAYDPVRRRLVLFGGAVAPWDSSTAYGDTWEWDGRAWAQVATTGPSARVRHVMAYDRVRGRVVLHGGNDGAGATQDTWEWDGVSWLPAAVAGPAGALLSDGPGGRVVLVGAETWEWTGAGWLGVAAAAPSSGTGIAYDLVRRRVVVHSGGGATALWEWDGAAWRQRGLPGPVPRSDHALAYDLARGRVVLFGGMDESYQALGDTWEWDGASWSRSAATGAEARWGHGLAYDEGLGRTVLFGGRGAAGTLGDTWEWDGVQWTSVTAPGPAARYDFSMAYDASRGRVVLFGGEGVPGYYRDTWERSGASWSYASTEVGGTTYGHAMAYDAAGGRVIRFGGNGTASDTDAWNGGAWMVVSTVGPARHEQHAMACDPDRQRTLLFGGHQFGVALQETWEWDGVRWTELLVRGPGPRTQPAMAHDRARGETVLFGGLNGAPLGDTWVWSGGTPALQFEVAADRYATDRDRVSRIAVRAFAGGALTTGGSASTGAVLLGWGSPGPANEPGAWIPLQSNATPLAAAPPYVPAAPASLLAWESPSEEQARRLLLDGSGIALQLRPRGSGGANPSDAGVALDYLEVRVRYAAP